MRISIGNDHRGVQFKLKLADLLKRLGHEVVDAGTNESSAIDYPDVAAIVAKQVAGQDSDRGILICGTGIGMSMAANKHPGIRAALITDPFCAAATREHNDANVLCMGERVVGSALAKSILDTFSQSRFEGGRHQTRINKMDI